MTAPTEKTVLCFGDSLTWGWEPVPEGAPARRYPADVRWTGVLAERLGAGHRVVEEGLNARTTTAKDPTDPRLDGSAYLPAALASHLPLDLVVIMLGTNDTKAYLRRTPTDIGAGMSVLAGQVLTAAGGVGTIYPAPKLLIVAPPPLGGAGMGHPWFDIVFEGAREKTLDLPRVYAALADHLEVGFFDAGTATSTDGTDGVHLTAENNRALGEAIVDPVRRLLA